MFYNYKTVVTAQWKDTSLHRAWGCFCLSPPQVCREGPWPLCTARKCPPPLSHAGPDPRASSFCGAVMSGSCRSSFAAKWDVPICALSLLLA